MTNTKVVFIGELTERTNINNQVDEKLMEELAAQGFFEGTKFCFVGIYYSSSTNTVIIGYPKYCSHPRTPEEKKNLLGHISLICKVASRANLNQSKTEYIDHFNAYTVQRRNDQTNPYELALFIMQDYAENGLYTERFRELRSDGVGYRDWNKTLRKVNPIFDKDPIYLKSISVVNKKNCSQLFTSLHAYAVRKCEYLLRPFGLFQHVSLPEIDWQVDEHQLHKFVPEIERKMVRTYSERELRLLRALRAWCGQNHYNRSRFGVTSFPLLWEYATKQYFGNITNTKSGQPQYFMFKDGNYHTYIGSGESIPDIIYAANTESGDKGLAIFDAKYYFPNFNYNVGKVYGAPPNADIAKQIGYYHYFKQLYTGINIRFANVFLMPQKVETKLYNFVGYVTCSSDQNIEIAKLLNCKNTHINDKVLLYNVDPTKLFLACLNKQHISSDEIFSEFISRFNE